MPERIQLRRAKGWRKPEGAIVVARPSQWGNHYKVVRNRVPTPGKPYGSGYTSRVGPLWTVVAIDKRGWETGSVFGAFDSKYDATTLAVDLHRESLAGVFADIDGAHRRDYFLGPLRDHDLACWCPLDGAPCHADTLLELANAPLPPSSPPPEGDGA